MTEEMKGRLSVVTGASTGIGDELASLCAEHGMNLVIASHDGKIDEAAAFRGRGADVTAVTADLSHKEASTG